MGELCRVSSKREIVFSNLLWRLAERFGAQAIAFIVSIVLARILEPEEYGIIALITVFITILQVFVDSGLGNALIQKKNADEVDFSTVFFTNLFFCAVLYLILFCGAPLLAIFYHNEQITAYFRVLGLTVVISGIKNIQQAYVARNMLFHKFFFSTLCGTIIAGVIGIVMAVKGCGVWALIAQQVINLAIDTLILWVSIKWRPQATFNIGRLKRLFSFGSKLLIAALIENIYTNLRQLLIGKLYSTSQLAYYNRGYQFPSFLVQNVDTSINSVLLPTMSKAQDDFEQLKNMTRRAIKTSTYFIAPCSMGLAFASVPIVSFVLTEKWLPCVEYMRLFCLAFMFYPIHTANLNAIQAIGRSDIFLKLEILKKIVGIISLVSTMFISVKAMAYSMLFTSIVCQFINAFPNKKLLKYGYLEQIRDIFPSIGLSIAMGVLIYPIQYIGLSCGVTLLVQILLGIIIYIVGSIILHIDSFFYLLSIVESYLVKFRKKSRR